MFEKLLASLPYNPSLVHQLSFYAKRMHREQSIRRLGLVFIVLAFFVQFFAVMNPPQPSVADSTNDLIDGGISSRADAASHCRNNVRHYREILGNYGITCEDVTQASTISLKSTDHDKSLYSMGWIPQGPTIDRTGKPTGETYANIDNVGTLYWRHLWSWDSNSYSTYTALKLTSSHTGKTYFILYNCGNLVSIGLPTPYTPPPPPPPCKWDSGIPSTSPNCHPPACPLNSKIPITDARCKACPYDKTIPKDDKRCVQCPNPRYPDVTQSSPKCKEVCPYNSSVDAGTPQCKPCTATVTTQNAIACVLVSKTASDTTQGWSDANDKTAQPGDTIIYTLHAKNTGKATVKQFVFQENLSDVMDYVARDAAGKPVIDLHGGKITPDFMVSWSAVDIKPNQTLTKQITIQVANPIPDTPVSTSDNGHFDLVMVNTYGNTIKINVPGTPLKTIELASTTTLPNTGPGSSLVAAGLFTVIAGYFFARSRLLATESIIAVRENAQTGGI